MTTIAVRDGEVVADTQLTAGNGSRARVRKLIKLDDGSVFAGAGELHAILALREWAIAGFAGKRPAKTKDAECIHCLADGSIRYMGGSGSPYELIDEYLAIGSGASFAEGAMAHGATALQALQAAAKHDTGTSGPFQRMRFGPERKTKRK